VASSVRRWCSQPLLSPTKRAGGQVKPLTLHFKWNHLRRRYADDQYDYMDAVRLNNGLTIPSIGAANVVSEDSDRSYFTATLDAVARD